MISTFRLWLPLIAGLAFAAAPLHAQEKKPNIVFILIDDLGYGDIAPFGSKLQRTPNLDRLANEGMKLTSFYACPVCTPSRAQIMTGCYAKRVSLPGVLFPIAGTGLSPNEITIARLLKNLGYVTMCIGKWHLGDQPAFLPTRHGFDHYFGLPYSNDMIAGKKADPKKDKRPPLPLLRDDKVIETVSLDGQDQLTERYTAEAIKFLRDNKDRPFFLYLPHTAIHGPLHPGQAFRGKSKNGLYGDWVEETDASIGRVMDALRDLKLDKNTLVVFSSDNGATKSGSNAPFNGFKASVSEGGMRVPTIAWWPGKIAADTSSNAVTGNIDLLPTFVKLAGGEVPKDRVIDGKDLWPLLSGTKTESPHDAYYCFAGNGLMKAVRSGPWKLYLDGAKLYHLDKDLTEKNDVAAMNPDVVKKLQGFVERMDKDLGVSKKGPGVRAPGRVENPQPLLLRAEPKREGR
jgi:arylsulfatase A